MERLVPLARSAGPLEPKALVPAFGKSKETAVGLAALEALSHSPGLFALTAGDIRSGRDLLEAILFPSEAGFARGYEAYNITTSDGRQYFGTIPRENPETVFLMPSGLDRLLTQQELVDLVAYLRSLR